MNPNGTASVKKKKSGRFNLIDFIIVLIILSVIATVVYIFAPFSKFHEMISSDSQSIQYTVEILGVEEEFIELVQKEDVVIDSVSKNHMGIVEAVDYNHKFSELRDGEWVEHANRYNLIITISATADYMDEVGYQINGERIAVGEQMTLRFPNYVAEGYCIGIMEE